jgi:pimeloyl-ACP methyl ester carboxylesterase
MFPADVEYADMLYFHLLDRGVFTRGWGDNCFLSTEHSDEDIEYVIRAVQESCREIRGGGFFPEPADPERIAATSVVEAERVARDREAEKKKTDTLNRTGEGMTPSNRSVAVGLADLPSAERMSTINPIQEEGDLPPLFCMPAADGLTLVYHELSQCLGSQQPVYGLDSPAIYREAIPDTLEALAARFIEDMREIQPHGPYLIIGYCSGGTTALEVAQQLRRQGEAVALLGMIETYNWWDAPSTHPTFWVKADYQRQRLLFHSYNFLLLPWRQKRRFLGSKWNALVRRLGVWRSAIGGWTRRAAVPREGLVDMAEIWRKHDDLAEAYLPTRYPGRLVHFRPKQDYRCHRSTEYEADQVEQHRLRVYPAGMMVQPFVADLAQLLQQEIARGLGVIRSAKR